MRSPHDHFICGDQLLRFIRRAAAVGVHAFDFFAERFLYDSERSAWGNPYERIRCGDVLWDWRRVSVFADDFSAAKTASGQSVERVHRVIRRVRTGRIQWFC